MTTEGEDLEHGAGQHTDKGVYGPRGDCHLDGRPENQHIPDEQSADEGADCVRDKPVHVTKVFVTAITLAVSEAAGWLFGPAAPGG
jgi:hypothetical protein